MSYDTPLSTQGQQLTSLPLKDQLRRGFRDMGSRSYSSARNFGLIGAMFAGTECCIDIAQEATGRMAFLLAALLEEFWAQRLGHRQL
ncbi:MAG: hypothetical protein LQ346_000554 [Caloplaca aetnensis]|nr:MAG: hypothetical protein LQ346_000554 [Caloplaca aetnensis]